MLGVRLLGVITVSDEEFWIRDAAGQAHGSHIDGTTRFDSVELTGEPASGIDHGFMIFDKGVVSS
jgi:hypothetical protein